MRVYNPVWTHLNQYKKMKLTIYVDPMVPNWSNVAEQMSETLKSIESRENEWD